jgi:hypothetical protein
LHPGSRVATLSDVKRSIGAAALLLGIGLAACSSDNPRVQSSATIPRSTTTTISLPATTSTSTTSTSTTSTSSTTTTTTIPLVTAGAVVKVANASGVPRAAAALSTLLSGLGFTLAEPVNAAGWEEQLDVTKVYARDESRAVAESVARMLGGVAIERMPTPAPIDGATVGLGEATVLVMLGADLAGQPLPPPAPAPAPAP